MKLLDSYYRVPREKMRLKSSEVDRLAAAGYTASMGANRTVKFSTAEGGKPDEFYQFPRTYNHGVSKWVNEFNNRQRAEGRGLR
jgi:hypothetical protein